MGYIYMTLSSPQDTPLSVDLSDPTRILEAHVGSTVAMPTRNLIFHDGVLETFIS